MEKVLFEGKRIRVISKELPGSSDQKNTYQVIDHPGAVVILPFLDSENILLIQNVRYAIDQTLLELPAGTLEKREEPKLCAARELEEETGYRAKELKFLLKFYSTPGFCNEILHVFTARELTFVGQKLDPNERIEVVSVKLTSAYEMIHQGVIKDNKTISTLLYYKAFC